MEKFTNIKGIAAPMMTTDGNQFSMMINVDTDMIILKQFLKTIKRTGLGKNLFHEMRYDYDENEIENFILNKEPFSKAKVLLAGNNFGCGSSREHAPWALLDFGIKCVIGSSFADIFYNNCFKNGMLPIVLDLKEIEELIQYSNRKESIEINLQEQEIIFGNKRIKFAIDQFKKNCLLNGLDDIALSLEKSKNISSFEDKLNKNKPWIS